MKSIYLLLAGFSLFLISCSSSYRSTQTVDDVYYSPGTQDDNYVSVQTQDDEDSYGYRNDVQEEWYIRRGIRDARYRNSVNISLGYGSYWNAYNPFLTYPMFGMGYASYGMPGMWDPFSPYRYGPFMIGYGGYYGSGYGYGYGINPHYYGGYSPYYGGGFNAYYPYYYYGIGGGKLYKDNGPRITNFGSTSPVRGTTPRINGSNDRPTLAPIRTMRSNSNSGTGTIERRNVTPTRGNINTTAPAPNRNIRKFSPPRNNNNNYHTPSRTEERRYTPPRNNDVDRTPIRTFERTPSVPTPSVPQTTPSTPRTNTGGGGSAPVRKF